MYMFIYGPCCNASHGNEDNSNCIFDQLLYHGLPFVRMHGNGIVFVNQERRIFRWVVQGFRYQNGRQRGVWVCPPVIVYLTQQCQVTHGVLV